MRLFFSTLDEVSITYEEDYFKIIEYVNLGLQNVITSYSIHYTKLYDAGNKSGVNWIRLKDPWMAFAKVLMANVFANPGTPSSNICPCPNNPINNLSTIV